MLKFSTHQDLGKKIKSAYGHLLNVSDTISGSYPTESDQAEVAKNALAAIRRLKFLMDDTVGKEHSDKSDGELNCCYFGDSDACRR